MLNKLVTPNASLEQKGTTSNGMDAIVP